MTVLDAAAKKQLKIKANKVRHGIIEGVYNAKSGHPGGSLSIADIMTYLYFSEMNVDPKNPKWEDRDRFVLSSGHGSMLMYSLLHLFGYGLTIEDLKQFRQFGSKTPGHPEFGHTDGVEVTTGPLGSGFSSAVGMAIANRHFAARTGLDKSGIYNNKIFIIIT